MNRVLTAVEKQRFVAPIKATVREYLTKEWLPAIETTIRPSTYDSCLQHVECHIVPHIGAVQLQKPSGARLNALHAKLARVGKIHSPVVRTKRSLATDVRIRWVASLQSGRPSKITPL